MFDKTERVLQLEALPENAGNDILFIIEKDYWVTCKVPCRCIVHEHGRMC